MDVVIVADFCGRFDGTDNGRFMYLARILRQNHNVEIVTSDFYHRTKEHLQQIAEYENIHVTMLHEREYSRNVSLRRLWSHWGWGKEVGRYLVRRKKPDVVYCAMPPLKASYEVAKYCQNNGIRFVIDIQDLWPEAFQMVFNVPVLSEILFMPLKIMADSVYSKADAICAVSNTYAERAIQANRKGAKAHAVYLGTELAAFDTYALTNSVASHFGELWLGYCGTLGASYDLTTVINALAMVRDLGIEPPRFIVMGDGERRGEFEALATHMGIKATFTGRLPYPKMCGMLAACDMTVNPISRGAAGSIINKHGDYAAAGIPVLNTQESTEYRNLVDEYHMGINIPNGDISALAEGIMILSKDKSLRLEMGINAHKCAMERFDRGHTYYELIESILS